MKLQAPSKVAGLTAHSLLTIFSSLYYFPWPPTGMPSTHQMSSLTQMFVSGSFSETSKIETSITPLYSSSNFGGLVFNHSISSTARYTGKGFWMSLFSPMFLFIVMKQTWHKMHNPSILGVQYSGIKYIHIMVQLSPHQNSTISRTLFLIKPKVCAHYTITTYNRVLTPWKSIFYIFFSSPPSLIL